MDFYKDDTIRIIFDISGGDIANEILSYLDYEQIAKSDLGIQRHDLFEPVHADRRVRTDSWNHSRNIYEDGE